MSVGVRRWQCPWCGNTRQTYIQDNGLRSSSPDYTLLCVAPIPDGQEDSFGRIVGEPKTGDVYKDADGVCGHQWEPNNED